MKAALSHEHEGSRTFALVLATDDEAMGALARFATERQLSKRTPDCPHAGHQTVAIA